MWGRPERRPHIASTTLTEPASVVILGSLMATDRRLAGITIS